MPALALVVGIGLGLAYAWGINPVEWTDGEVHQMRADLQEDYMRMLIDSYSVNHNADLALDRYRQLGEGGAEALDAVASDPREVKTETIQSFRALLEIESEATPAAETEAEAAPEEESAGLLSNISGYILPVCGVTLLLGLLLAGVLVLRSRAGTSESTPAPPVGIGEAAPMPAPATVERAPAMAAPGADDTLATFRTIYTIGDDDYDDSFSIESPTGEFLGECGVGIGELIGVGEPKKVSAFEVWLFDKNDIQTVTKVMMSDYTYRDEESRTRLAAKGDPVTAEPGAVVTLQTASLEVEARIVDMSYGQSNLPAESYFERLTIELRAWSRDGAMG